ncbi:MAG: tyrosine--tRNA ligase [Saprospiraceae bacterium]|nr:tyrosine--tRNA ligase [Saprospiraceae bacterium]
MSTTDKPDFFKELQWRGMLHDATPGIEEHLAGGMRTGYIGFDPTAPSMTIGNFVQIMILSFFQRAGHRPIVLMGGATGRIGDPSGKDKERQLKSFEELDHNLRHQQKQAEKLLNFEDGPNKAFVVNNIDFYKDMNILTFLRDVGKTLTVNYMQSKESVKKRIETGISFTEFSYQLLQGYDYQMLFQKHGCTLQMGGSDQWGNITSGTEFIRKNLEEKAYAATTPLLTKSDGTKFGKSEAGNIWLDPELTSPYRFYQYWINTDDKDLSKLLRYFSFKTQEEILALEASTDPQSLKRILSEELTIRVHSADAYKSVLAVSELLFNRKASRETLLEMSKADLQTVAGEITSYEIKRDLLAGNLNIVDFLTEHTGMLESKGEARRAIQSQAISINKEKVTSHEDTIDTDALLHGGYIMVENGKKNKFMVVVNS